jgi:prepilin peptidase CpaA
VLLTAGAAVASDVRTLRIPNLITLGAAALAFIFYFGTEGLEGLGWSAGGWAVGCLVFLPVFLLRGMGAGDVKLLAAIGAWVGPVVVLWTAAYAAIAGAVLAVGVSLAYGSLLRAWKNVGHLLSYWRTVGPRPVPSLTLADAKGPRLPYAVPIAVGILLAVWFR